MPPPTPSGAPPSGGLFVPTRTLLLRGLVSGGILVLLIQLLDLGRVPGMILQMELLWIMIALGVTVLQTTLSAWRWSFTASRLGIHLPLGVAVKEYYLGTFLNQLLPGGVMGDVSRAWRHTRAGAEAPRPGPAFRAVILERASGQLAMVMVALLSLSLLPGVRQATGLGAEASSGGPMDAAGWPDMLLAGAGILLALAVTVGVVGRWRTVRSVPLPGATRAPGWALWTDARAALLSPGVLPAQLGSSLLVVASYVLVYLLGARAMGIDTPAPLLLPLVAPVLLSMLIPLTLAGWGVREGAAALVWAGAGLPASEGVAISVAYGLIVLVSTLPGLPILLGVVTRRRGRGRRGGPPRGGSVGTADGWPAPASPPGPG